MLMKSYLSAFKCRSFDLRVREEVGFSKDETTITESFQKLSFEVRRSGRRGACSKL